MLYQRGRGHEPVTVAGSIRSFVAVNDIGFLGLVLLVYPTIIAESSREVKNLENSLFFEGRIPSYRCGERKLHDGATGATPQHCSAIGRTESKARIRRRPDCRGTMRWGSSCRGLGLIAKRSLPRGRLPLISTPKAARTGTPSFPGSSKRCPASAAAPAPGPEKVLLERPAAELGTPAFPALVRPKWLVDCLVVRSIALGIAVAFFIIPQELWEHRGALFLTALGVAAATTFLAGAVTSACRFDSPSQLARSRIAFAALLTVLTASRVRDLRLSHSCHRRGPAKPETRCGESRKR